MLKVSEIFYSIQGEGKYIGSPAIFIRLALCNLQCCWCDSKYTWDWKNYSKDEIKPMTSEEIYQELINLVDTTDIKSQHSEYWPMIIFTGGEPLLQQKGIIELIDYLDNTPFNFFAVETNGTIKLTEDIKKKIDYFCVSLKTSNSGNQKSLCIKPHIIEEYNELYSDFKFVVSSKEDLKEIEDIITRNDLMSVILMPEGTSIEEILEKSDWLIEICKKRGYTFSPRLQTILWGNTRGI